MVKEGGAAAACGVVHRRRRRCGFAVWVFSTVVLTVLLVRRWSFNGGFGVLRPVVVVATERKGRGRRGGWLHVRVRPEKTKRKCGCQLSQGSGRGSSEPPSSKKYIVYIWSN
ncbi:hypothetical protein HAX54_029633 [Datura stramonium]|uniref:Uncharacterized protein n=1 Tax=Datura stramonium TaxID=4076 RepID=A0ABS8V6D0_DATST|nr:hypothetical protein [Datura stramonium]